MSEDVQYVWLDTAIGGGLVRVSTDNEGNRIVYLGGGMEIIFPSNAEDEPRTSSVKPTQKV